MSNNPSRSDSVAKCLACDQDSNATPLIDLQYQGAQLWICPQHMPVLIHNPTQLTGILSGAEGLKPADDPS